MAGVNPNMPVGTAGGEEIEVAKIPKALHEHINTAFPAHVCLVGTVLPDGFAQVSPRKHDGGRRRASRTLGARQGLDQR
jgi:hypothetical protein